MEFDKNNFRPTSLRELLQPQVNEQFEDCEVLAELLQQQVNEQFEVCDVMVKVGHWERKYHKFVLLLCPFFECLFSNDFLERNTGTIHLKRETPSNVDMALMFLYGKEPILNDDNIADLIDLAEFFMIPNLKSACVKWLESTTISEENCMHILEFSSLYDFDLPNCTNYFIGHLVEMLSHERALHLTCDSVNYILTEKTFSYLRMEDRLRFLARWYKTQPKHRFSWVKKFLKMLIFEEIPSTIVDELKTDLVFGQLLSGCAGTFNPEEIIPVYIFLKWPNALCFDMERNRWFKIDISATEHFIFGSDIIFTDSNSPVVYIKDERTDEHKVIAFNLKTGVKKELQVDDAIILSRFKFCCNMSVGYDTTLVTPNVPAANRDIFGAYTVDNRYIISTVFIRYDEMDDTIIKMMPKFSLKGSYISILARNPISEVAIELSGKGHILIYNNLSCSMTKLEVEMGFINQICPTERGFVIHDDTRCICITRPSGPELSQPYEIKTISLTAEHRRVDKYFFCSNIWFRLINIDSNSDFQLQCVKHDTLLAATTADDIQWNDLPRPTDSSEYCESLLDDKIHLVGLPRRMLRCHLECPHCDAIQWESSVYFDQ